MSRHAGIIAVVAAALLALSAAAEDRPSVDSILERYVTAVGGRDAIERLSTRVCVGRVVTDLSWTEPRVQVDHFVAWASVPDRIRIVTEEPDGEVVVEIGDSNTGWKYVNGDAVPGESIAQSNLGWLLDPRNALRVREHFPGLAVAGYEMLEGRGVWILEPALLDPAYWRLAFDAETGLLVRIGYYWSLEDYRRMDGVLFPCRATASRKGGSSTRYFDRVWHGVEA